MWENALLERRAVDSGKNLFFHGYIHIILSIDLEFEALVCNQESAIIEFKREFSINRFWAYFNRI